MTLLVLCHFPYSTCSQKVRFVLAEKVPETPEHAARAAYRRSVSADNVHVARWPRPLPSHGSTRAGAARRAPRCGGRDYGVVPRQR